jgi:hypothetical protein
MSVISAGLQDVASSTRKWWAGSGAGRAGWPRGNAGASIDLGGQVAEFEGRWFVTDGWATGSGVEVERPATSEYVGRAVLSRIEAARGSRRPLVLSAQEHPGNQRGAAEWERFCTGVAGVPMWRYRPEKRLMILADETGCVAMTRETRRLGGSGCLTVGPRRWARR